MHEDSFSLKLGHKEMNNIPLKSQLTTDFVCFRKHGQPQGIAPTNTDP